MNRFKAMRLIIWRGALKNYTGYFFKKLSVSRFGGGNFTRIVYNIIFYCRDDVEEEDYKETIFMQPAEQEEEDLSRIKEESRRRRQAILEKYKTQQSQQKHELKPDETGKPFFIACFNLDNNACYLSLGVYILKL